MNAELFQVCWPCLAGAISKGKKSIVVVHGEDFVERIFVRIDVCIQPKMTG